MNVQRLELDLLQAQAKIRSLEARLEVASDQCPLCGTLKKADHRASLEAL